MICLVVKFDRTKINDLVAVESLKQRFGLVGELISSNVYPFYREGKVVFRFASEKDVLALEDGDGFCVEKSAAYSVIHKDRVNLAQLKAML